MLRITTLFLLSSIVLFACKRMSEGEELLNKTIAYHDPMENWPEFKGQLNIELVMNDGSSRGSQVSINLPENRFSLVEHKDSLTTIRQFQDGDCTIRFQNPYGVVTDTTAHCERTAMLSNYYTYLYGLPMKLKDPGTIIDPVVEEKELNNKRYKVLKVSYKPETGGDTWYIYINPVTYAMEAYQFYHNNNNKGEYILLNGQITYNRIKIPKDRKWYTNEGNYLGEDILTGIDKLSEN